MSAIVKFPGAGSLTRMLGRLSPAQRMQKRRRIEAIAASAADSLTRKYGTGGALAVCRRKLAYCVRHAPGVREQIWILVYRTLRPAETVKDRWRREPID